jgi:hypothetical protein
MPRIDFWSRSLSRVELDQHAREARFRLQQLERLRVSHAAALQDRRWLPFGIDRHTRVMRGAPPRKPSTAPSTWHLQIDGTRDGLSDAPRCA